MSQFCTFLPKISLYLNFKIIFHVIFEYVKKKKKNCYNLSVFYHVHTCICLVKLKIYKIIMVY